MDIARYREMYAGELARAELWKDVLFAAACEKEEVAAEFIRPVLGKPGLTVTWVQPQYYNPNLVGHSTRMDVTAADADGHLYDIELQQVPSKDLASRLRLYAARLELEAFKRGEAGYRDAAQTVVIVYCRFDPLKAGQETYPIGRCRLDTKERYEDGSSLYLVNGSIVSDSPLGCVVHDLGCKDPGQMRNGVLASRVGFLKNNPEGVKMMYERMDSFSNSIYNDGVAFGLGKGRAEAALNFLAMGLTPEQVAKGAELPLEEVLRLQRERDRRPPQ